MHTETSPQPVSMSATDRDRLRSLSAPVSLSHPAAGTGVSLHLAAGTGFSLVQCYRQLVAAGDAGVTIAIRALMLGPIGGKEKISNWDG